MDSDIGQPSAMRMTPGFDIHNRLGLATPGFEGTATNAEFADDALQSGAALGGLTISEMPRGQMDGAGSANGGDGDMPSMTENGAMPIGAMENGGAAGEPGAAFSMSGTGPGADGMPGGDMSGDAANASDQMMSEAAARAGELALEGRWRLTLSSITN